MGFFCECSPMSEQWKYKMWR